MITQFLQLSPFRFISLIVQGQLAITAGLSVIIAVMLLRRNRRQAWTELKRVEFAELLVAEMLDALEGAAGPAILTRPRRAGERAVLKGVLLEHLRSVSGFERELLIRRYEELGYVDEDLRALNSRLWWRRLRGASDLASLDSHRFALDFHRLCFDRHELVSAFAFYALSGLDHQMNQPFSVRKFPVAVQSRRNLMTEILRNWARVHGPQCVTEQIGRIDEPRLLDSLVTAASTTLTTETSEAFADLLRQRITFSPEVLDAMLTCLRKVGDPQFADVVRPFAKHANDVVRLRALEYLVEMGEDDILGRADIVADRSVKIRRALERWRGERVAA